MEQQKSPQTLTRRQIIVLARAARQVVEYDYEGWSEDDAEELADAIDRLAAIDLIER